MTENVTVRIDGEESEQVKALKETLEDQGVEAEIWAPHSGIRVILPPHNELVTFGDMSVSYVQPMTSGNVYVGVE